MGAETSQKPGSSLAGAAPDGPCVFDVFELDLRRGTLRSDEGEITLRPKTYSLLCYLVAHAGRLIPKEELLDRIWPGVVVTEDSVVQCVGELRAALGKRGPEVLKTVPRRGYILNARVTSKCVAVATTPARPTGTIAPEVTESAEPTRPARPTQLAAALVALTLLAGSTVGSVQHGRLDIDRRITATRMIAILPFTDLSEPASPALAEAVGEDLKVAVAQLSETLVIASGPTVRFGATAQDVADAGKALGASHVLTGNVQRAGDAVLIRAQLRRAGEPTVLWSERFEYTGSEHWNWQRDITRRVANALDTRLRDAYGGAADSSGYARDAVEATQKGDFLLRHATSRDDLVRARAFFERALAVDAGSIVAMNGMAFTHLAEVAHRWSTDRQGQIKLASDLLDRSMALRPNHAMTHYGRSQLLYLRGRIDEAAQACEQALVLSPNHLYALQRLGFYRLQQGRAAEVAAPVELALRLNPLDHQWASYGHFFLGMAQFHLRRDDVAYDEMRKAAAADPANGFSWQWMAAIDALHGRDDSARANLAHFERLIPKQSVSGLRATESSANLAFWAERERFYEGLGRAGLAR